MVLARRDAVALQAFTAGQFERSFEWKIEITLVEDLENYEILVILVASETHRFRCRSLIDQVGCERLIDFIYFSF